MCNTFLNYQVAAINNARLVKTVVANQWTLRAVWWGGPQKFRHFFDEIEAFRAVNCRIAAPSWFFPSI